MIGTYSRHLAALPGLEAMLGAPVVHLRGNLPSDIRVLAGWGFRPSTNRPRQLATRFNVPFLGLEDGFLRSFGTGRRYPTLSLVVDELGIYYAADRPSALEELLASETDVLCGPGADYAAARARMVSKGLSKYNHAPDFDRLPVERNAPKVLVVDQTLNDASVVYGLANEASFARMLETARREHPTATIYIKTHPEVSVGAKQGYLSHLSDDDSRFVMLREPISPASLLKHMDHVYTVTSHLGFEALLHGVPVTCFGMPWYAGWGVTDDRQLCQRRRRRRTVDELFAAAYLHYTRYLNPDTGERGTIFQVMDWIERQRDMHRRHPGRSIAIGFRRWKAHNLRPFLGFNGRAVHFVGDASAAAALLPTAKDRFYVWGNEAPSSVRSLSENSGAQLLHLEDGFIRSVGLGSDFVAPRALAMDSRGLYFDARQPSDLEVFLNTHPFTDDDRHRATIVHELIVKHRLTKYNIEPIEQPSWHQPGRKVVLVPGQVEDDASIRYGCSQIRTNLGLLAAVRQACPDAFIVYKPHPDVKVRNRAGRVHAAAALRHADIIETEVSIVSCIEACDEMHTMTSLSGFDALLRGKPVVTYGMPFYAGWGLTYDRLAIPRRTRQLSLKELIAGTLLHYPVYHDPHLNGYTTCEASLRELARIRDELAAAGHLHTLGKTYWQRQWHKFILWAKAGFMMER